MTSIILLHLAETEWIQSEQQPAPLKQIKKKQLNQIQNFILKKSN